LNATVNKTAEAGTVRAPGHGISFGEAFQVWLRVAVPGFGGPAGLIAVMHRILVEEKNWISESRFLHALNRLSPAAAAAILRLSNGMLWLPAGRYAAGVALRLTGMI
jgi:chromate transporter